MLPSRRGPRFLASLGIIAAAAGALWLTRGALERDVTGVAEAIDGDSLRVGGIEVRLSGVDAPELMQTCTISGQQSPCGRDARLHLQRLTGGWLVTCVGSERDRYGRMLGRCRARGLDVNAAMVRDGHAIAYGAYEAEEAQAKAAFRGLWAGSFERPRDWRMKHPRN